MAPQQTLADLLETLHNDPVMFVRTVLGAEPQAWQIDALNNINSNTRVSIRSGHGVGKTACLSWIVLWFLVTRPCRIVCTANSASQLEQVLWPEIRKWMGKMPKGLQNVLEYKSDKITVKGVDSSAHARTSSKDRPEALQGFHHASNMLFVLDEASGIPDVVYQVAQGALSSRNSKAIMMGNPTRNTGFFADSFGKDAERWHNMTVSCEDADYVSSEFIEDMARQYGEDSNVYRVRVLGLPPESNDDSLIARHLVDSAVGREVEPMLNKPIWGLDIAAYGSDRSALAKRQGNVLLEPIKHWRDKDLMETVGIVLTEWEATPYMDRPTEICCDAIGIGAGVSSRLQELGLPARSINVAESPALKGRYPRLRDELWFRCREWFEARDCALPDDCEELIHELTSLRYKILSTGKFKAEGKDEMKKRGLKSPDLADSLVLTFAGQAVAASGASSGWGFKQTLDYGNAEWIV